MNSGGYVPRGEASNVAFFEPCLFQFSGCGFQARVTLCYLVVLSFNFLLRGSGIIIGAVEI